MGGRARLSLVAIGCALLVAGVAAALTHAVPVRTGTNEIAANRALGGTVGRIDVCQEAEQIPAGTGAVRVSLASSGGPGPALALRATNGRTTIARGRLTAGWRGRRATIPLRPVVHAQQPARICVSVGAAASVVLAGEGGADPNAGPPATAAGSPLKGRLRFEYLAPARASWWSQIGAIARRMSFGRGIGGGAAAPIAALLMLAAAALALWQMVRRA